MNILVVLGNRLHDDGTMTDILKHRLDTAFKLYPTKIANGQGKILVTGGIANTKAAKAEGDLMAEYLVSKGVPTEDIIIENKSRTTRENAKFSAPIIKELQPSEVIICSSQYHIERWYFNPIRLFRRRLGESYEIIPLVAVDID